MITSSNLKAKIVAGSALVLLFGSGIVVGLAWSETASVNPLAEVREDEGSRTEGGRRRLIVDKVGLSAVQKANVDSLVVFHRHRMSQLDKEFQPRYWAVISDLREEIKQVLTDDQRAQYDVLLAERDERRRGDSRR